MKGSKTLSVSLTAIALVLISPFSAFSDALNINGDDKSEIALFRDGKFSIATELGISAERTCGGPGTIPLPGNYLAGMPAKLAVWNPSFGIWHICSDTVGLTQPWGAPGDIPVPADYNGDGITDYAVFRPLTGEWFILINSGGLAAGSVSIRTLGRAGDLPVPADYDGDNKADIAVFRAVPDTGGAEWRLLPSSTDVLQQRSFGLSGDLPVPADYDGDGSDQLAVWRPSDGTWYVRQGGSTTMQQFGLLGDIPSPVDFDGDAKADFAVYRPAEAQWFLLGTNDPSLGSRKLSLGQVGDRVANHSRGAVIDRRAWGDYDGDRTTDLVVLRVNDAEQIDFFFPASLPSSSSRQITFGEAGDKVVSGDFDGDAISDLAVVKASEPLIPWRFRFSSEQSDGVRERIVYYGLADDILMPADYDGDGKTDLAVVRDMLDGSKLWIPSNSTMAPVVPVSWGFSTDQTLTADVDGDAKSDFIVVREVNGELLWLVRTAVGTALAPRLYGFVGDEAIAGDYNGDGKAEIGVIRDIGGFRLMLIDTLVPFYWGFVSDQTFAGNYVGTRALNQAVWRVVEGQGFFFLNGRGGEGSVVPFGVIGDIPLNPLGVTDTPGGGDDSSSGSSSSSGKRLRCETRTSVSQQGSGFFWKTVSDADGKLAVLFPSALAGQIKRAALVESGAAEDVVLETLRFVGNLDGGRPTFRATKPGSGYPQGVILVRQAQDNKVYCIDVPNPGTNVGS